MLEYFKRSEPTLGGLSLVSNSTRGCYLQRQGRLFASGTTKWLWFANLSTRAIAPSIDTGNISNTYPFAMAAADSASNMFGVNWMNGAGQRLNVYIAKTGESAQTFINNFADAPASVFSRHAGCVPCMVIVDGDTVTICQLGIDRYTLKPEYLYKTTHTSAHTLTLDDYQGASGYTMFNRAHPSQSGTPVMLQANPLLLKLADGLEWTDIDFDLDTVVTDFMRDPTSFVAKTRGAWDTIVSPRLVSASGVVQTRARTVTAGSDFVECPYTGYTWTINQTGSGSIYAREPFALPSYYPQQCQAVGAGPTAIEIDGVILSTEVTADHNKTQVSQITVREPKLGGLVKAPVYFSPKQFFLDASNSSAETVYNGEVPLRPSEEHEAFCLAFDEENPSLIALAKAYHATARSDNPASGDTLFESGCFGFFDGTRFTVNPTPRKGLTGTEASLNYLVGLVHKGTAYWASRRAITDNGTLTLAIQPPGGQVRTIEITAAAGSNAHVRAGYPTNFIKLTDSLALITTSPRVRSSGTLKGCVGDFAVIVNLDTLQFYAPRTGEEVTGSLGSILWEDSRFYIQPGQAQTALIAGTFTGAALTEERTACFSGGSYFVYRNGPTTRIGSVVTINDPQWTNDIVYQRTGVLLATFDLVGTQLVHDQDVDLTDIVTEMAPDESEIGTGLEEWQTQEIWPLYNRDGDLILSIAHGTTGGNARLGSTLSIGVVRRWHEAEPTLTAYPNEFTAASYGAVYDRLRPVMVHRSRRAGLQLVTAGNALTPAGITQPEGQTVLVDLNKYLEATAMPTVEEIVEGVSGVIPQDKVSVSLAADGDDLKLTITASGQTITAYSLTGVAITRSSPYLQFTSSASGQSAQALTATIADQADLAAEDVDVFITVTTSQSGVLPQEKIRWRPPTAVLDAIGEVQGGAPAIITQEVLAQDFIPFGTMSDGWARGTRPIRAVIGSTPTIAADTSKWGKVTWSNMSAPTSSDTDVATVGSVANSTYGINTTTGTPSFKLTPVAEGTCTVTVDAVGNGQARRLVFDVIGVDAEAE